MVADVSDLLSFGIVAAMSWLDQLLLWLPDFAVGTVEIRDLLNVALGALGIYLAYLGTLISKKQDRILDEQRTQKAELHVELFVTHVALERQVCVANRGTKGARDFYWHLLIPVAETNGLKVVQWDVPLRKEDIVRVAGMDHLRTGNFVQKPAYPGRNAVCATLRFDPSARAANAPPVTLLWRISSEDGQFPSESYGQIVFDLRSVERVIGPTSDVDNLSTDRDKH